MPGVGVPPEPVGSTVSVALFVIRSVKAGAVAYLATITATIEARLGPDAENHTAVMQSRLLAGSVRVSLIGSRQQLRRPFVVDRGPASRDFVTAEKIDSAALVSASLT